jgi:hypothetical protein
VVFKHGVDFVELLNCMIAPNTVTEFEKKLIQDSCFAQGRYTPMNASLHRLAMLFERLRVLPMMLNFNHPAWEKSRSDSRCLPALCVQSDSVHVKAYDGRLCKINTEKVQIGATTMYHNNIPSEFARF